MSSVSITSLLGQMSIPRLEALFGQEARRAADWVFIAAVEGLPQAQVCYGRMLLAGTGMPKDPAQALKWFRRAALNEDADAINMVGRCLDNGWGTAEDAAAAAQHFQRAADLGHAWAQYNVGHMYLDGRGVPRDRTLAYLHYSKAAGQQHERAMNLLGRCCEQGWGTPRNLDAAADWYRRSAEAGYFRGQYNWASMLLRAGRFEECAAWFERAAVGGTAAMRRAVMELIARAGAPRALQNLAARLQAGFSSTAASAVTAPTASASL
jgi:TPR repeat protein